MSTPTERLFQIVTGHGLAPAELVTRALDLAREAHHGQFRKSGDPYIVHPVAVATIVAELGADVDTIALALLHDVPGDTPHTLEQIRAEFGDAIYTLLAEFVRAENTGWPSDLTSLNPAVLVVKVADRLHNMRTIRYLDRAKQQRKADQTLRLVAPAARSVGLDDVAAELEALATETLRGPITRVDPGPFEARRSSEAGIRVTRGVLRVATSVLLPTHCRQRWLAEWDGELHALPGLRSRLTFTADLLLGLPCIAAVTRGARHPFDGDDE